MERPPKLLRPAPDDPPAGAPVHVGLLAVPGGPAALRTERALARLGPELEVSVHATAPELVRRMRAGGLDLLVLDGSLGDAVRRVLAARDPDAPPALVVAPDADEELALSVFRCGAADCVALGDDYEEVLPVAALEQIQRYRAAAERGAAERRIRWLERLHEAIVEEIPAALAVIDARGRLVTVNPEFSRCFAAPARGVVGRRYQDVLPEALRESGGVATLLERAAAGRAPEPRLARMRDASGERAFDVRAQRLDDERRVLLVLAEVTRTEALSNQLADLRRFGENVIENVNSALVVVDLEGRISYANPAAESILGEKPEGSLWRWFDGALRERLVERTLREGVRFRGAEGLIARGSGERVPIGTSCAPLVDRGGVRRGAVVIFQDLSEIKQLQRQVLQAEKMASIGQLAAGVAHEINNPMGFIHANLFQLGEYVQDLTRVFEELQGLRKAARSGSLEEVERAAERLDAVAAELDADYLLEDCGKAVRESLEGSERIRHIVQDLRAFSHPDGSERSDADVNECLDSTANIVWTMMKHAVVLTKEYRDLPPVRCFPMQLKQVFMNLLVNAYQALGEAGRGPERPGEIRLRTRPAPGGVVVEVEDDGIGIPAADLHRIFDPFFTTKEVGVGTGLGLSIAYNIVKRHGGTLRVESEPGVRTRFSMFLPRDGGEAAGEGA